MGRNKFVDPKAVRPDYSWQINHDEEESIEKARNIQHGANTGNTGLVKQQSDSSPLVFKFSGSILHKAQVVEMMAWWELCEEQTILFTDYTDDEYEVIITRFAPKRARTIKNPRDFANAPLWFWKYEIEMEVIRVISGTWEGVTP